MAEELRVLVVASDPLARAGLAALLTAQPGCLVVGQMPPGPEVAGALAVYRPAVLLWDLGWDTTASLEQLASLHASGAPPIAALLPNASYAGAAWTAGARGLLLREAGPGQIHAALVAIGQGLAVLDAGLPAGLAAGQASTRAEDLPSLVEEPTPRELEVLKLMAEGLPNKAIAQRLGISEHTVKFHVNAILSKLGVQSRTEAVVQATRRGLILL